MPILDILHSFDAQGSGNIYRSNFVSTFIDNYLKMPFSVRTGQGLTLNQKHLLTSRYTPNPSIISFPYSQFVEDLKRKEEESRGSIRVYLTKKEIEDEENSLKIKEHADKEAEMLVQRILKEDL